MPLRSPLPLFFVSLLALGTVAQASAQASVQAGVQAGARAASEAPAKLVDRVVAVVDEDPILASDIERVVKLGLLAEDPGGNPADERRRALDLLIEQRLRLHEVDRFGFEETPLASLELQLEATRARFPTEEAFRAELVRLGLDESSLRQLLARELTVLAYVEERLGPRVFVSVDDITRYYNEELLPELQKDGAGPGDIPTLDSVREGIRAVLRERRLNDEIDRWTAGLRAKADVVDYLDQERRDLPPLVE